MEAVVTVLAFLRRVRVADETLRLVVIGLFVAVPVLLVGSWPTLIEMCRRGTNVALPLAVGFGFLYMFLALFSPRGSRSVSRALTSAAVRLMKVTAMTLVNLTLFLIRIGAATVTEAEYCKAFVDAGATLIERQAELLIRP